MRVQQVCKEEVERSIKHYCCLLLSELQPIYMLAALQATMAATTTTSAASYKSKLLKVSMWVKSYLE
jgi:hypothetical protein